MGFLVTTLIFVFVGIIASLCVRICCNRAPSTNLLHLTLVITATVCCWMITDESFDCTDTKRKRVEESSLLRQEPNVFELEKSYAQKYQVEMLVDDGQNYAVFSVGAKDILGLIKHKAPTLATHEVLKTHGSIPPPALEQLRGGVYVFHVLTTPIFTSQSGPFSVVGISEVAENSSGIALVQIPAEEGT